MSNQFWRLPKVQQETGLSRTSIFRKMEDGTFPKSFKITERSVAWLSDEVEQWKAARLAVREAA